MRRHLLRISISFKAAVFALTAEKKHRLIDFIATKNRIRNQNIKSSIFCRRLNRFIFLFYVSTSHSIRSHRDGYSKFECADMRGVRRCVVCRYKSSASLMSVLELGSAQEIAHGAIQSIDNGLPRLKVQTNTLTHSRTTNTRAYVIGTAVSVQWSLPICYGFVVSFAVKRKMRGIESESSFHKKKL